MSVFAPTVGPTLLDGKSTEQQFELEKRRRIVEAEIAKMFIAKADEAAAWYIKCKADLVAKNDWLDAKEETLKVAATNSAIVAANIATEALYNHFLTFRTSLKSEMEAPKPKLTPRQLAEARANSAASMRALIEIGVVAGAAAIAMPAGAVVTGIAVVGATALVLVADYKASKNADHSDSEFRVVPSHKPK